MHNEEKMIKNLYVLAPPIGKIVKLLYVCVLYTSKTQQGTRDDFSLINRSLARQDRTRGFVWTAAHPSLKSIEEQADQSASSAGRLTQGNILWEKLLFSFMLCPRQPPLWCNDQYVSMSKHPVRPLKATSQFQHVCLHLKRSSHRENQVFWDTSKQLYIQQKNETLLCCC